MTRPRSSTCTSVFTSASDIIGTGHPARCPNGPAGPRLIALCQKTKPSWTAAETSMRITSLHYIRTKMSQFKHGTVVYDGVDYARGIINGRAVLYPLDNGKMKSKQKFIYEHRLVYEITHNEKLEKNEIVHHINGDKTDNSPENLIKMDARQHISMHLQERNVSGMHKTDPTYCIDCGKKITYISKRCPECAQKARMIPGHPTKEQLEEMLLTMNNSQIARHFNVSDTAVRKWRKRYGLPPARKAKRLVS